MEQHKRPLKSQKNERFRVGCAVADLCFDQIKWLPFNKNYFPLLWKILSKGTSCTQGATESLQKQILRLFNVKQNRVLNFLCLFCKPSLFLQPHTNLYHLRQQDKSLRQCSKMSASLLLFHGTQGFSAKFSIGQLLPLIFFKIRISQDINNYFGPRFLKVWQKTWGFIEHC